jgi:hypothetical protein
MPQSIYLSALRGGGLPNNLNVVQMDVQMSATVVILYCNYYRTFGFQTISYAAKYALRISFESCLRVENYFSFFIFETLVKKGKILGNYNGLFTAL